MRGNDDTSEIDAGHIQVWLLSFLRFAVTRDEADRNAFLARAQELDRGGHLSTPAFSFFSRTSAELCRASLTPDDPPSRAELEAFLKRVPDVRLRRALEAALGLEPLLPTARQVRPQSRAYLWQGLVGNNPRHLD